MRSIKLFIAMVVNTDDGYETNNLYSGSASFSIFHDSVVHAFESHQCKELVQLNTLGLSL